MQGNDSLREQLAAQLDAFRALLHSGNPDSVPLGRVFGASRGEQPDLGPLPAVPGLATVTPAERQDFVMRSNALERLAKLRSMSAAAAGDREAAEVKRLETLPSHKRVREALLSELRKSVTLGATSATKLARRNLVESSKEGGGAEEEAIAKQRKFLATVTGVATAFQARRYERQKAGKEMLAQLMKLSENSARRKQMEEERQERERVQMLRQGDEEGYMKMLQTKKNARLEMLLQQTADFMEKIASMVQLEKNRAFAEEARELARDRKTAEEEQKKEEELERVRQKEEEERQRKEEEAEDNYSDSDEEKKTPAAAEEGSAVAATGGEGGKAPKTGEAAAAVKGPSAVTAEAPAAANPAPKKDYLTANQSYMAQTHTVQESVALQPKMLKFGILREYQLKGLQWLVSLYNNNLNGILADEMGLGKTIQTIAFLAYLMETKKNMGPFLIIVPLSTVSNWKDEFDRWTPEIDLVVYQGAPARRQQLWNDKLSNSKFNVLLTTFDFVMRDKAKLSRIHWNFLIIDEGHRIKNSESKLAVVLSKSYRPKHRLLLTGTPLQNSLPELWSLLNFLLPKIFNSVESFEDWFNSPFATSGDKVEMTEEESLLIIRRLHVVLRPFLLRRLKKEVEKQLPDKLEKVLRCDQSEWQKELYQRMLSDRTLMTEGGVRGLQNKLMQLRKICNHPYLFDEKSGYDIDEKMIRAAGKFALLDHVLPKMKAAGHRVLIFSQMTSLMDILGYFFTIRGWHHLRLDGATKQDERRESMKLWNAKDSPYFIFMLSTRAGGLGLNLQTADTVVLFDSDWNPQADLQAQDRAHRIGQTKRVLVLRLITAHTIEERILETATRKLGMDQKVIGAGGFNNASDDPHNRKSILEQMLRSELTGRDDQAEVHTLKEINKRISRSEQEYALFKRMDEERFRDRERRVAAGETVPPEMVSREELPAWLTNPASIVVDPEKAKFKDIEGMSNNSFGRGKRRKAEVDYADQLDDDEFCMLVERGATEDEVRAYIAERNANGGGGGGGKPGKENGSSKSAAGDDDGDGDHDGTQGNGADGDMAAEEVHKPRSSKVARVPDAEELRLQGHGLELLDALRALRDPATERHFADSWQLLWGPDGPRERKRGRPITSDKPIDMTDVANKIKKLRYKRFAQIVADLDKMFSHLLATLPQGSQERSEAAEGVKLLHLKSIEMQNSDAEAPAAAVAVAAGPVDGPAAGEVPPNKKLKLKLTVPVKEENPQ